MKTTYSPSLRSGEDSLPGKRQETSAGILRVRISHSILRRVTEEPCHEPRSGPDPASSSSIRAPLKELDMSSPEKSAEEELAAEESLELQGPVVILHRNGGGGAEEPPREYKIETEKSRKKPRRRGRKELTGDDAEASERGRGRRSSAVESSPSEVLMNARRQSCERARKREEEEGHRQTKRGK